MATCRIAIIGLGKIATDRHLPAILADPAYTLVAVATLQRVELPPGVRVFADHRALLADDELGLDAVAICTPPMARHGIARDAMLAGKDVLLEKPTSATLAEAEDLARVAKATGRVAFATWHSRFNESVRQAKTLLAEQAVRRLHIDWKEDVRTWHPGQDWIWRPGGFGVFDPGINALSILTAIAPNPVFVRSAAFVHRIGEETPVAAELRFAMEGCNAMTASFDWRPGPDLRVFTIETDHGASLTLFKNTLVVDGATLVESGNTEYGQIYAEFTSLRREGRSEFDLSPMRLVADSFMMAPGLHIEVERV